MIKFKTKYSCLLMSVLLILLAFTSCGDKESKSDSGKQTGTTTGQNTSVVVVEKGGTTATSIVTVPATTAKVGETLKNQTTNKPNNSTATSTWFEEPPAVTNYQVTDFKSIYIENELPDNLTATSSWDAMGVDNNGVVYFGFTCTRRNDRREDFAVFSYTPSTQKVKYLGSFMTASEKAGNLLGNEQIPKGHTKFIYSGGKMYMASQGFHDFKQGISTLKNYRGAHIYAYDIAKDELQDLSATQQDGIIVKNEGIVALNFIPSRNLLVGLTHPHSNLVFYNIKTGTIERNVQGIPWAYGNPLSREIIVSGDKVYMYRGVEEPRDRAKSFPVYVYDYKTDKLTKTDDYCFGGFWNGQATTKDGKTTFISTSCGELYKLNHATGRITHVNTMVPAENWYGSLIDYVYSLTMSPDGKKIFYIPTMYNNTGIIEYDIEKNVSTKIYSLPKGCYTGNGVVDKNGYYYFVSFSTSSQNWAGDCKVIAAKIEAR